MHRNVFVLIICILSLIAYSCGKKEGVIPNKYRIDHVSITEFMFQEDSQIFNSGEYVGEQWYWDDGRLLRIDYRGKNQYSENFYYDGRRIIRTTVPAYTLRSEFNYESDILQTIDVYKKDTLVATLSFKRDDKHIAEITCLRHESDSNMEWPMWAPIPLRALVGEEVAKTICLDAVKMSPNARSNSKSSSEIRYKLVWNNDNVERIDVSGSVSESYTISLTYDDKFNPYQQLYANHELNETLFGFKMLSENNITSFTMPYQNKGTIRFNYSYSYNGDLPQRRKLTYNYISLNNNFDSVSVRVEKTEEYFYLDSKD